MNSAKVDRVEYGELLAVHRHVPGPNSRLAVHEHEIPVRILRVTMTDGATGMGFCYRNPELAGRLIGCTMAEIWDETALGIRPGWSGVETPFWDLAARYAGVSVARYIAERTNGSGTCRGLVPTYDSSLLFDELAIADDALAVAHMVDEARDGYGLGHRAFKIKIGRGAMHMPLEAGTRRDIAVTRAIRDALGPDVTLMLDANDGLNFNLAVRILGETADANIFWLEEPFREDVVLLETLHNWMARQGISTLIADGEYNAAPELLDWARDGFVNVVQFDLQRYGMTRWLQLLPQLAALKAQAAPHHWGTWFNNYAGAHLASAMPQVLTVEWDEASCPAIDAPGFHISDGNIAVPDTPGWGLELDEAAYAKAVTDGGFSLR